MGFYVGNRLETFDTEAFAIMRAVHFVVAGRQTERNFVIFTDSQAAMQRIASDQKPSSGQTSYTLIRWVSGHKGVVGNETADAHAKGAAAGRAPDRGSKKAMERIIVAFLK